jgi:hypothetical protein
MAGPLWAGIVVLVLVALGFVLVQRLQSGITFPDTIAGYQHNESQIADAVTETVEERLKSMGVEGKVAIYGDLATPGFVVIAFETGGSSLPGGMEDFASGFAASGAGSVDTGRAVTDTRGDVTYRCATVILDHPATVGDPRAVCLWTDQDTAGVVVDAVSADTTVAMDLTSTVHEGVAG